MKWRDWLAEWGLSSLKIKLPFLDAEWKPADGDRLAAWDLYVELLTRITTQPLANGDGVEKTALDSVFAMFALTRTTLKTHGPSAQQFAKLAIVVLNQVIRPFTARWHRLSVDGAFDEPAQCQQFRNELREVQAQLVVYTRALAALADVEDLTKLEAPLA